MIYVEGFKLNYGWFPDGTPGLTNLNGVFEILEELDRANKSYFTNTLYLTWIYNNSAEQVIIDMITRHIKDLGFKVVLYMPYIPNARMDRKKNAFTEVYTLKYFAQWLNSLEFEYVCVLDPHSPASFMIDRVRLLDVKIFHQEVLDEVKPDFIVFPDKGAAERYRDSIPGYKIFYGEKVRNWKTGKIEGLDIINPSCIPASQYRGKRVLVIDDICSRGGTFVHTANELKKMGFGDLYLAVTHCEKTIELGDVGKLYKRVYTTDSMEYSTQVKSEPFAKLIKTVAYDLASPYEEGTEDNIREMCELPKKEERGSC